MDPLIVIGATAAITFITVGILTHFQRKREPNQPKKPLLEIASYVCAIASLLLSALPTLSSALPSSSQAPGAPQPASTPARTPPTPLSPTGPDSTSPPPVAAGYVEEHREIPFTIRTAHDDSGSCSPYIAIDFDGSPSGDHPITTRVIDEDELTTAQQEAADMHYVTCQTAELRAAQTASVGLLRNGKNATPEQCAAAASSASIGNLDITKDAKPAEIGFIEGSAICAVTPNNLLARATITKITYNAGIFDDIPTVEFSLSTWNTGESE